MNIFLVKTKNNMKKYLALILEACPSFNSDETVSLGKCTVKCPAVAAGGY